MREEHEEQREEREEHEEREEQREEPEEEAVEPKPRKVAVTEEEEVPPWPAGGEES